MKYISTRGAHPPVESAVAINLGLAPDGGLFIPESLPLCLPEKYIGEQSYQQIARSVLELLLTDYTGAELQHCIGSAYTMSTFDTPAVVAMVDYGSNCSILELWHGPTAAFKDVALQIMPYLMTHAKKKTGNNQHTVILVATSGDTGKAALEGFCNVPGISIVVFYPAGGVSEIQRLQMATTEGTNTAVVAVEGNFDDCQTGVKSIFSDEKLRWELMGRGIELSSANSINWGRLCPQIVYYFTAYADMVRRGKISSGDKINFAVPTGNFGNILAGYYAKRMGLPINKLICASNKNRVLSDFFATGTYRRNRDFYQTNAPSMDILISSNLERFLFEMCGHDHEKIAGWYRELAQNGEFTVDAASFEAIGREITGGWVDEDEVLATINNVYITQGYVVDTHTAVAVALVERLGKTEVKTVIASTASPYKFSRDVLGALEALVPEDEFDSIARIAEISGKEVHRGLAGLDKRPVRHTAVITVSQMRSFVENLINQITVPAS